jgi:hypothetical protein
MTRGDVIPDAELPPHTLRLEFALRAALFRQDITLEHAGKLTAKRRALL